MPTYDNIHAHLSMLADRRRTEAYREAIARVVRPGDTVLDFGTGTGVLAIFAERAGAAKIYALDKSRMIEAARQLIELNGCKRIQLLRGDASTLELPEPVDVIVSEWMGHFLFDDEMLEPLIRLRDNYLRPGGRMLPERCSLHAGLMLAPHEYERLGTLRGRPYDIDFGPIAEWPFAQSGPIELQAQHVLPHSTQIGELEMATIARTPERLSGIIVSAIDCVSYGLCGWFEAQLTASLRIGNSPFQPSTSWKWFYFPFDQPLPVRAGEPVAIELAVLTHPRRTSYTWSARSGNQRRQGDDVLVDAWLAERKTRG